MLEASSFYWYISLAVCASVKRVHCASCSRSFNVTDFGTNRKPICDFLLWGL